ncbi:MAG: polyphosphate:AMP phosphotransferase [Candidatus Riflebacteria bacterium]|nr:polyphosphate:AMP phosphotransferase [Candidatus Riflebacteria bacterium]
MLEMIDLTKKLGKKEFKIRMKEAERKINELQRQMKDAGIPTIVVFEGPEAAGKGTCINRLMMPLDPRGFKVHPIHNANEDERLRPFLYRFWTKLPSKGRLAIFDNSWYKDILDGKFAEKTFENNLQTHLSDILAFERQHAENGSVIIKFWLHISKKEQKKRFKVVLSDESTSWKIGKFELKQHREYDRFISSAEEIFEKTNTDYAPWILVEAHDHEFAIDKIFTTIINTWQHALSQKSSSSNISHANDNSDTAQKLLPADNVTILSALDLTKTISEEEYEKLLRKYQKRLRELEYEIYKQRTPVVIAFEGCDAAGKGGAIKRLTENLDPRGYEVIPIAAPTKEELDHHYLWRFARVLPKAGHITVFDRTWYGRVLVERIEGFCSEKAWKRAFREINEFERHLTNYGTVLVKFWLQISSDEQLKRFQERKDTPWKNWKITDEDWRNREKWPQYERAINDMLANCSTASSPFTIVEADNKCFARIKILKTVIDAIEKSVG